MRKTIAALAVCGIATGALAPLAQPAAHRRPAAALDIRSTSPLTVVGSGFRPREHVRVSATLAGLTRTLRATVGSTGGFRVVFLGLGASRCDELHVVAIRQAGTLVVLKRLPAPACSTG